MKTDKIVTKSKFRAICFSLAICFLFPCEIFARENSAVSEKTTAEEIVEISGQVLDSNKDPLAGAVVLAKGDGSVSITGYDGKFIISVPVGGELSITFMGMQEEKYVVKKGDSYLVISMKDDVSTIEQTVVTGYSTIKKESFTGNTVTVTQEELLKASKTNVIAAIQTFDPSFRIKENNTWGSDPNALPEMYIRGESGIGLKDLDKGELHKSKLQDNPNLPTFIMDGFEISVQTLYDYDPTRIQSIVILKDAAATAVYGSRAANGVVVITTVPPKPGKVNVSYSYVGELITPDLSDYDLLNAAEKLELEKKAGFFTVQPGDAYTEQYTLTKEYYSKLSNVKEGVDTYWLNKPLRNVFNHKHSVYIDGGSNSLRYGVELRFSDGDGVMKNSFRNQSAAGVYLQYSVKSLVIKNHITYSKVSSADSNYGSFSDFSTQLPYDKYFDENGSINSKLKTWGGGSDDRLNPMYEPNLGNFSKSSNEQIINNLSMNWNILPSLLFKSQFSISREFSNQDRFYDPLSLNSANIYRLNSTNASSGTYYMNRDDGFSYDFNSTLSYNSVIKDIHMINALVGFNLRESNTNYMNYTYIGFPNGNLSSPMYAKEAYDKGSFSENKNRLVGALASVNYSLSNIYLADASVRLDGSSVFGANKRFATFYSGGLGINIHNYEYFKDLDNINLLKIRGSYGETGKSNFPSYAARTSYGIVTDEWFKTGYSAQLKALGNTDLTWETTHTFDVGFEFAMFDDLFYIKGSYYNKLTTDLINDVTIPSSTGFTTYLENIGEISNKGVELDIRLNPIRTKDWNLVINANLAHNKNRIEKISESLKAYNERVKEIYELASYQDGYDAKKATMPFLQYEEGGSLNSIFAVRSLGINPADGQEIFLDRDGNKVSKWNAGDQVAVGSVAPTMQGSLGFNLRYKQFNLYTSFMYEFGGQRYNQTLVDKVENVDVYNNNVDRRVSEDRWMKEGDVAKFKAIDLDRGGYNSTKPTSRFVQDYNVLSLSSLELSYDVPESVLSKAKIGMLRFTLGSNELFRLSSVKMERGLSYPYSRTVNLSARISF